MLRLWCALCGAGIVPFGMLILKEVGCSVLGIFLGGIFLVFGRNLELLYDLNYHLYHYEPYLSYHHQKQKLTKDTALTTQSRLILLDSMLMLFCVMSVYFWIKFHSKRHLPFTPEWWFWLSMTGVGLAAVTGVKMVGLFTVATVGIATLVDLWELLDIKKGHSMVCRLPLTVAIFWKALWSPSPLPDSPSFYPLPDPILHPLSTLANVWSR